MHEFVVTLNLPPNAAPMLLIAAAVLAGTVLLLACLAVDSMWGRRIVSTRRRNRPATAAEGRAAVDAEMARHFGTPHRAVQAAPARREVGSAA